MNHKLAFLHTMHQSYGNENDIDVTKPRIINYSLFCNGGIAVGEFRSLLSKMVATTTCSS